MTDIFKGMKSKLQDRKDYAEWASELENQISVVKTEIIIAMYLGLMKPNPQLKSFLDSETGISQAKYDGAPRKPEGDLDASLH